MMQNQFLVVSHSYYLTQNFLYKLKYLMTNSADSDQLASSDANWSGSTVFAKSKSRFSWTRSCLYYFRLVFIDPSFQELHIQHTDEENRKHILRVNIGAQVGIHKEAAICRNGKHSKLQIMSSWVLILLEAEFDPRLYDASLQRAFYFHPSIMLIC